MRFCWYCECSAFTCVAFVMQSLWWHDCDDDNTTQRNIDHRSEPVFRFLGFGLNKYRLNPFENMEQW